MNEPARGLMVLGAVLVAAGLVLLLIQKVPFIGKLPGDFLVRRGNFTVYFPLATGIVLSLLISLILSVIGKLR